MGVRSGRWIIRAIEFPSPHISQGTPSPLLYESKTAEEEKSFLFPFSSSPFHLKQGKGMVVTFFSCEWAPARLASTKWIFDVERGADWGGIFSLCKKMWGGERRVHFWQPLFLSLPPGLGQSRFHNISVLEIVLLVLPSKCVPGDESTKPGPVFPLGQCSRIFFPSGPLGCPLRPFRSSCSGRKKWMKWTIVPDIPENGFFLHPKKLPSCIWHKKKKRREGGRRVRISGVKKRHRFIMPQFFRIISFVEFLPVKMLSNPLPPPRSIFIFFPVYIFNPIVWI